MLECVKNAGVLEERTEVFTNYFERQVLATPNATAIEFEGSVWTYGQANSRANQIASFLVQHGFQREDRIGICMDRSAMAIITMLGILKSGCAFVPLDPEFPKDRLAFIVEDASIQMIFCDSAYRELYDVEGNSLLRFVEPKNDQLWEAICDNPDSNVPANSLAYVMYTSGSTGKPKGVQIEHRSLTAYCLADVEIYRLTAADRTLQFSTLNFDIAIEEIFPPLMIGSAVVVRPRERAQVQNELSHLIETYNITAMHIATAYWNEWVDLLVASKSSVPECLRLLIATGEKISVEHFRRWKQQCHHDVLWCNAYGPTETTVTCTAFIPNSAWDQPQMPIGKPLPGYSAYILNDQNAPLGVGDTGHLFIGGPGLARGYLNRLDLTEKAFLDLVIKVDSGSEESTKRLYRTGDLARWLPSGDIEFSGRVDHQMKIGSYRIEPGEIEVVLSQCEAVRESLVVCSEGDGHRYLVAYVVRTQSELTAYQLASFLRERLPSYMVPARYIFIDAFPKTINGKIDRRALPDAEQGEIPREGEYQAAATELERELACIWASVLNVPTVGRHDDFFQLGGSSLLVTRVIAQISGKLDRVIPVRDFFANPTIASLCRHISALQQDRRQGNGDLKGDSDVIQAVDREYHHQSTLLRSKLPRIEPVSIVSHENRLAAIKYSSVPAQGKSLNHCVVICNAYGHESTRSFRNLQQLAIQIAQAGFDVIRFDYSATGNSSGEDHSGSLDRWKDDIAATVDYMRHARASISSEPESVSVLGLRLGASLVAQTPLKGVANAILWDPIVCGKTYLGLLHEKHRYEAQSLTRYLIHRRVQPNQFLGYDCTVEMQEAISVLNLAEKIEIDANKHWIITSGNYSEVKNLKPLLKVWKHIAVSDEVLWDTQEVAQRAFSSPQFSQAVLSILTRGNP